MWEEKRQGYEAVPLCCDMAPPFRPLAGLSGREVASPSGGSGNREGFVLWLLAWVFPAAPPLDARVTGSRWPSAM